MKPRNQNKILARSSKTNVVLFVIQLSLLFDKTESGEPGDSTDSTDSSDSSDSTDSMFSRKVTPSGAAKSFSINGLRLSINQASLMFCIRLAPLASQARIF